MNKFIALLQSLQYCPFDQTSINSELPPNEAILGIITANEHQTYGKNGFQSMAQEANYYHNYNGIDINEVPFYCKSVDCIKQLALLLRPQQQCMYFCVEVFIDYKNNI